MQKHTFPACLGRFSTCWILASLPPPLLFPTRKETLPLSRNFCLHVLKNLQRTSFLDVSPSFPMKNKIKFAFLSMYLCVHNTHVCVYLRARMHVRCYLRMSVRLCTSYPRTFVCVVDFHHLARMHSLFLVAIHKMCDNWSSMSLVTLVPFVEIHHVLYEQLALRRAINQFVLPSVRRRPESVFLDSKVYCHCACTV